jgi:hypothetical protein
MMMEEIVQTLMSVQMRMDATTTVLINLVRLNVHVEMVSFLVNMDLLVQILTSVQLITEVVITVVQINLERLSAHVQMVTNFIQMERAVKT